MPKAKKQVLTQEERLTQALVPESEQPYVVPRNWVWTRLGKIFDMKSGKFISANDIHSDNDGTRYPCYGGNGLRGYADTYNTDGSFPLIGRQGALCGNINMAHGKFYATEHAVVTRPIFDTNMSWAYHILNELDLNQYATATAQPGLAVSKIAEVPIPFPPLAEQHRIVTRVESLFDKLDRAKELSQSALDRFETRKAAILHQAFTGVLTARWREVNGVGLESWEYKPLKDVARVRSGYAFDSKTFVDSGYQVVRMGNLYNGVLDLSRSPVFIPKDSIEESIRTKFTAARGDILLTLTGTKYKRDYGYAVLIEHDTGLLVNQRIMAITSENIEQNLILYYLRSNIFRDVFFSNETGGVNQGNVSSTFTANINVPVPTPPEQTEIVCILDSLLKKEQQARHLADIIEKIDHMKKAILARAFRGELGTNDPNEESAMDLLSEAL